MSERWVVRDDGTQRAAPWVVRDLQDRHGPPVASFATRAEAQAHADHLSGGPFDWDEQEAWKDDEDEDEDDAQPSSGWT